MNRRVQLLLGIGVALLVVVAVAVVHLFTAPSVPTVVGPVAGPALHPKVRDVGGDLGPSEGDTLAAISRPVGSVFDISVDVEPRVAMITFNVTTQAMASLGPSFDPTNLFVALDDNALGWIPLPSHWDATTRTVQAIAPHLSRTTLRAFTGGIRRVGGALSSAESRMAAGSTKLARGFTDAAAATARAAGGALAELGQDELNGVRIIGTYLESLAEGVVQSFTETAFPEQEAADCSDRAQDITVETNVDYLEGCTPNSHRDQISLANHGFLPYVVSRSGLKASVDLTDDTDLDTLVLDVLNVATHRTLVSGHRARSMTLTDELRDDPNWKARADPYFQALFVNAVWALLKVLPVGRKVEPVITELRVEILTVMAELEREGQVISIHAVFLKLEATIENRPTTTDAGAAVESLKNVDEAFSCVAAAGKAFAESDKGSDELPGALVTEARKCASTVLDPESRAAEQIDLLNSFLEVGPQLIHDVMGLYEGAQLTNIFASQILVTNDGATSPPAPTPADVWFTVQSAEEAQQEPTVLNTTGDSSEWFTGMRWTRWSAGSARGTGTMHRSCKNVCDPGQPQVNVTQDVEVVLDQPLIACGRAFYSRITIDQPSGNNSSRTLLTLPLAKSVVSGEDCPEGADRNVHTFASKTGNIVCSTFLTDQLQVPPWGSTQKMACWIHHHNFEPQPAQCPYSGDYTVVLQRTGPAETVPCSGDLLVGTYATSGPLPTPPTRTEYGQTVDLDAATCTTSAAGVRCVNHDQHGFLLSREKHAVF